MATEPRYSERPGGDGRPADAYFFLLKKTKEADQKTPAELEKSQNRITDAVKAEGGRCELYITIGPYDFLSKVVGVDEAAAHRLKEQLDKGGNVKATLLKAFASPLRK